MHNPINKLTKHIFAKNIFKDHSENKSRQAASVTRFGDFLNLFGDKFSYKSWLNIWWFFGLFWKNITFEVKTAAITFWTTLEKIGLFILTSGHTDCGIHSKILRKS